MSKKNLDKLFVEKFNSFQESPDKKVWEAIEASLNQKDKKRRIIPLWWKIGSIAAVLALGMFLINPFEATKTISPSVVTDVENSEKILDNNATSTKNKTEEITKKESTKVTEVNSSPSSEEQNLILNPSKSNSTTNVASNTKVASVTNTTTQEKELANQHTNNNNKGQETNSTPILNNTENAIAQIEQEKEEIGIEKLGSLPNQVEKTIEETQKSSNTIAVVDEQKSNTVKEEDKKSIYDAIEAQKAENEEDAIAKIKSNKWSAGASVAPVYFNAIGEGSPVGEMFVSNSKSGDTNLSYGLSIAYDVSNKLSIRSGLHKVDYAYSTNNVRFSSNFNGNTNNQLSTINYDSSSSNLELLSTDAEATPSFLPKNSAADVSAKNPAREGIMSQQFDYLEIPLELKYQLVDSKFGVDIIGGVSSLFLLDNSVLLSSGSITTTLGEANNMNSVNFSTNIGIGLNYKFTPKIKINVEPMFKYQLNTFSNTQGTFEPYSIGVYSGLTFKF